MMVQRSLLLVLVVAIVRYFEVEDSNLGQTLFFRDSALERLIDIKHPGMPRDVCCQD
jgi:hypothetical protein